MRFLSLAMAVSTLFAASAQAADSPKISPQALERWGNAETIFVGNLGGVRAGPVGRSNPPLYTHQLTFEVDSVLRGTLKKGGTVVGYHVVRQQMRPVFPEGKNCIVAVRYSRKRYQVVTVVESTPAALKEVKLANSLPLGWRIEHNKLVSPWKALGARAWPRAATGKAGFVCAATGRPALLAGRGVTFAVEKVPPKKQLKYGNPDGDGEFTLTVKNETRNTVAVPALLTDGKRILWEESLVILCQDKVYTHPDARGVSTPVKPVTLKPGQSVSGRVHTFKLKGPKWPRGGYRLNFTFCIGEKSVSQSFYYLSRHHDPIRAAVQKK